MDEVIFKKRKPAFFLLTGCCLLLACSREQPLSPISSVPVTSVVEPAQSASSEADATPLVPSPALEPFRDRFATYIYFPQSGFYETQEVEPAPETLLEVVNLVSHALMMPEPPVKAMNQQKGMVTLNFKKALLAQNTQAELERFFHSIAMTLHENHQTYQFIQYQLEGDYQALGGEEWAMAPLKLAGAESDAESKALRDTIAYARSERVHNQQQGVLAIHKDATAQAIAEVLAQAEVSDITFADPKEIPENRVILSSLQSTRPVVRARSAAMYGEEYTVGAALEPIFARVSQKLKIQEDMLWVQEHVEQSAKGLFGDKYQLKHQTVGKYTYFPEEGVYTPPHMGGGMDTVAAVLSYQLKGETVVATVAYAIDSMGGLFSAENAETLIAPEQLEQHLRTAAKQYTVTLNRRSDGSFYVVSQK